MLKTQVQSRAEILLNGTRLEACPSGLLWWPEKACALVADLHLEKGSAYATGGQFLPPHDTATTLANLKKALKGLPAETVICLGDSFHDGDAQHRMDDACFASLYRLTEDYKWIWIAGNHDPLPPENLKGSIAEKLVLGPLVLRHEALPRAPVAGEVSGHFHPKARIQTRAKRISSRCFIEDGQRLILPSFGAYTGGLNVLDPAIDTLFPRGFRVHLAGHRKAHSFPRAALLP